jgi:hypothetical protein
MTTIWEIDFYSRPILDDQQKKIWELLVCDTQRQFEFSKFCTGGQANARWLETALEEAIQAGRQAQHLTAAEIPAKIRFFRRQMNNIITRACAALNVGAQPSKRTFAMYQWLQERHQTVYPEHPGFQPAMTAPPQFEATQPQPLPDALVGRGWSVVTLPASAFGDIDAWEIAFRDTVPLDLLTLPPNVMVPGILVFSERAVPLAGWMSGLELSCLALDTNPVPLLILETGVSDRWVLSNLKDPQLLAEIEAFERTKQAAHQIHFLAVQSDPEAKEFAGFWVMQTLNLD